MADRPHVRYSALSTEQERPQEIEQERSRVRVGDRRRPSSMTEDRRYDYDPFNRVPWKSIFLAIFLLSFGTLCLILSYLMFIGHMGGESSQAYGFLTIGTLLFLPGAYLSLSFLQIYYWYICMYVCVCVCTYVCVIIYIDVCVKDKGNGMLAILHLPNWIFMCITKLVIFPIVLPLSAYL